MKNKAVSGTMLTLLLLSMLTLAFNIQTVRAIGTIYIRPDGSIDPPTAPIQRDGCIYTLTDNIASLFDGIVVEKNNVIVDGASNILQGSGGMESKGIDLTGRSNVTIKNIGIKAFWWCIYLESTSNSVISGNNITHCAEYGFGILLLYSSNNNRILGNNMAHNWCGIELIECSDNIISGNSITNNSYTLGVWLKGSPNNYILGNNITETIKLLGSENSIVLGNNITSKDNEGVLLWGSHNTTVSENNITDSHHGIHAYYASYNIICGNDIVNSRHGVHLYRSSDNKFYNNDLINNTLQVYDVSWSDPFYPPSINTWDNGYPSGGNYWSDYTGVDDDNDGIGDTPHVIDTNNQDNFPLISPWTPLVGDVDGDGDVDWSDFGDFATAYGASLGQLRYRVRCDLDQDGDIDWGDFGIFAANYGKSV